MKTREQREYEKQQERAKKHNCSGRCYWDTGMCPCVETCDETRTFEFIANAIAVITLILMLALVPIIFIAGVIALLWAIFAI